MDKIEEKAAKLHFYINRIEALESAKVDIQADIKDLFEAAALDEFDVKVLKAVLKRRKMSREEREALDTQVALYETDLQLALFPPEVGPEPAVPGAPAPKGKREQPAGVATDSDVDSDYAVVALRVLEDGFTRKTDFIRELARRVGHLQTAVRETVLGDLLGQVLVDDEARRGHYRPVQGRAA